MSTTSSVNVGTLSGNGPFGSLRLVPCFVTVAPMAGVGCFRRVAVVGAALTTLGAGTALMTHRADHPVTLASGDDTGAGAAAAESTTITESPTTTSPTTSTTRPPATTPTTRPKIATVIADKQTGDLPAGTIMSGPVAMTGTVRDAGGQPVAGACVLVEPIADPAPALDMRTGADGTFAVTFALRTYADWANVTVRDCRGLLPGFARRYIPVMAYAGQPVDVPVTVVPGSALRGVAVDAAQQPLADKCVGVSMNPILTAWVRTDNQGRWAVPDLPTGRYGIDLKTPAGPGCGFPNGENLAFVSGDITEVGSVGWVVLTPNV